MLKWTELYDIINEITSLEGTGWSIYVKGNQFQCGNSQGNSKIYLDASCTAHFKMEVFGFVMLNLFGNDIPYFFLEKLKNCSKFSIFKFKAFKHTFEFLVFAVFFLLFYGEISCDSIVILIILNHERTSYAELTYETSGLIKISFLIIFE